MTTSVNDMTPEALLRELIDQTHEWGSAEWVRPERERARERARVAGDRLAAVLRDDPTLTITTDTERGRVTCAPWNDTHPYPPGAYCHADGRVYQAVRSARGKPPTESHLWTRIDQLQDDEGTGANGVSAASGTTGQPRRHWTKRVERFLGEAIGRLFWRRMGQALITFTASFVVGLIVCHYLAASWNEYSSATREDRGILLEWWMTITLVVWALAKVEQLLHEHWRELRNTQTTERE